MEIVKLKLRPSEQGLHVTLTATNREGDTEGNLPQLPEELDPKKQSSFYCRWQSSYHDDQQVRLRTSPQPGLRITPISKTNHSASESAEYAEAVKTHLNQWLNSGNSEWLHIRDELVAICSQLNREGDEMGVLIDTKNIDLCRLPWQEWTFLENHCPQAEIALRLPKSRDHKGIIIHPPSSSKVRILVAIGRNNDINTDCDLQEIKHLEELGAEVTYLEQPNRKTLCDALWDQLGYHIFIFTGHSGSREDGQIGWIELNDEESLSIEDFKNAIKEAINRGLQLAVFNSCDGLGLANQLAQLLLPQSIVMREPVPDQVAVEFLRYFFQEFTRGKSLFASVHIARQRLEHFNSHYPGVEWLPVICISHHVKKLPTWQNLCKGCSIDGNPPSSEEPPQPNAHKKKFIAGLLVLALGGCGIAIWWGRNKHDTLSKQPGIVLRSSERNFKDVNNVPSGDWLYGGSTSWAKINSVVHPKIQQELPQINFKYSQHPTSPPNSETGIMMLLNSQISFAQSSRPLENSELQNNKQLKLQQIPVGNDVIAIVVHPSLNISGLTIEQLQAIYTGKITNWSQIGGPTRTITPYSRPPGKSGNTGFFQNNVLEIQNYGKNVVFKSTTTEIQKVIGRSDPGGIYYVSASEISKSLVKALPISRKGGGSFISPEKTDKYPIVRRLFVIIKLDGQKDEEIGKAYTKLLLTDEGQKLIKEALEQN